MEGERLADVGQKARKESRSMARVRLSGSGSRGKLALG